MDIQKKLDRTALKSYFVKNAIPTAGHFADLIDGLINQREDGIVKLPGQPLSVQADGDDTSQKNAINFYKNFADPKPAWTLSLNPWADPNDLKTAKPGWSIGDAAGNSKLFIDPTGNVGVGTVDPGAYKLNVNGPALFTGNLNLSAELRIPNTGGGSAVFTNQQWGNEDGRPNNLKLRMGHIPFVITSPLQYEFAIGHSFDTPEGPFFEKMFSINESGDLYCAGSVTTPGSDLFCGGKATATGGGVLNGVTVGAAPRAGMNIKYAYESIGVTDAGFNLRLCSPSGIYFHPRNSLEALSYIDTSGGLSINSDKQLKKDIAPIEGALEKILRLRGVTFAWREPEKHNAITDRRMGMIAQDVEEVFPEWVTTMPSSGHKGIALVGFEALVVETLRELSTKCEKLEAALAQLRTAAIGSTGSAPAGEKR